MMRGFALSVLGFCIVGLSHATEFSCQPKYDGTTDDSVTTQLMPGANTDWCEDDVGKSSVKGLLDICQKFCGQGRIPLLLGITQSGFNQKTMDEFCLNTADSGTQYAMIHDQTLMAKCKEWSRSFITLVDNTALFVGSVQNMERALLIFRASATEETQTMKETMASEEIATRMKLADKSDKMTTYLEILKASLSGLVAGGPIMVDIMTAMSEVKDAGTALHAIVEEVMEDVEQFSDQCGTVLLGVSQEQVYLADICMQSGSKCIDDEDSTRVGCCCGVVPASGLMDIDAASRRLGTGDGFLDICGQAEELMKLKKQTQLEQLDATSSGQQLLAENSAARENLYPDYPPYKTCPGRSLQGSVTEQIHQVDAPPSEAPNFHAHEAPPRQLPANEECLEVSNTDTTKTSRWSGSAEYCDDLELPAGQNFEDLMFNACSKYCGEAVPILVGASQFGFGKDSMDGICKNGDFLIMNQDKVMQCHEDAKSFAKVQTATAAFSTSMLIIESRKVRFEVAISAAVDIIVTKFEDGVEQELLDAVGSKKIQVVADMLTIAIKELAGTSTTPDPAYAQIAESRTALDTARADVKTKGLTLKEEVLEAFTAFDRLLTECNTLFTGMGINSEYLFDVCHQTANVCINEEEASHIGCCCGYLPLVELGKSTISQNTICGDACLNGASGNEPIEPSAIEPPIMMSVSAQSIIDICGQSTQQAKTALDADASEMIAMGGNEILEEWQGGLETKYPTVYGDSCSSTSVPAGAASGGSTTDDVSSGSGQSTNGDVSSGHSWVVANIMFGPIVACIAIGF